MKKYVRLFTERQFSQAERCHLWKWWVMMTSTMMIVHLERDASVEVLLTETFQLHTPQMQNLNFSFHQVDVFLSHVYQDMAFAFLALVHFHLWHIFHFLLYSDDTPFGVVMYHCWKVAQNVIRCCLRSKMDRGNILLHFHPLWILQWRQKAQRAASGDVFEMSYTYFSFAVGW